MPMRRLKKVTEAKIGTAEKAENITRELNAQKESAVGDLVTAAQLDIAKNQVIQMLTLLSPIMEESVQTSW